jgi:hypothetical protein
LTPTANNRFARGWKWLKRIIGLEEERREQNPQMELFDGLHHWQICKDCGQEFWCLKGSYSAITRQCARCYEKKIYEQFEKKLFERNAGEQKSQED